MKTQKAALVLSGGGALGVAHLGALKHWEQRFHFDFLAGVSAGALVAAGIACGFSAESLWERLSQTNFFPLFLDLSFKNSGVLRGERIQKLLEEIYQGKTFEELEVPLYVGATDFSTGRFVAINKGKLSDAVRASLSVPVLFEPYFHPQYQCYFVDGGLSKNFPLELALEYYPGNTIIGSNVTTLPPLPEDFGKKKYFGRHLDFLRIFERSIRILFLQQLPPLKDPRLTLFTPNLSAYRSLTFRTSKLREIFLAGYHQARKMEL